MFSRASCVLLPPGKQGRLKALLEEHPAIGVKLLQCFLASLSEKIMRSNELRKKAAAYDHNAVNEILEE